MKFQGRMVQIILVTALLAFFTGCAVSNPSKPEDALIVGRLSLDADGWRVFASCNINGQNFKDVYMYLQDSDTHHTHMIRTNNFGYFYWVKPKPGSYIIKSFFFERKGDDNTGTVQDLRWNPNIELTRIQVNPGQVVNLGELHWVANQETKTYQLTQAADSAKTLQDYFTQRFPQSLWLQREWVSPVIQTPANENPPELFTRETKQHSIKSSSSN